MTKSITPKVATEKARDPKIAPKVSAETASDTHRKIAPKVAAEKARDTHRKIAPKVSAETARDTHPKIAPKVAAEKANDTHPKIAPNVAAEKANDAPRKIAPNVAAEKANDTHPKTAPNVAAETARDTHPKIAPNVSAETASDTQGKIAAQSDKFRLAQAPDLKPAFAPQVPNSMRALAERSVAETRELYERSTNALHAVLETWERSLDAAGQGVVALNRKIIDIAERNISTGFELATSLAGAKNLVEVMEVQRAYLRKQFGDLKMQAEEVRALTTKVTADIAEPIKEQVARR